MNSIDDNNVCPRPEIEQETERYSDSLYDEMKIHEPWFFDLSDYQKVGELILGAKMNKLINIKIKRKMTHMYVELKDEHMKLKNKYRSFNYIKKNIYNMKIHEIEKYRRAIINYERFTDTEPGTTTLEQVKNSSCGIDGWAEYRSDNDII
jgi:hypothetical protein